MLLLLWAFPRPTTTTKSYCPQIENFFLHFCMCTVHPPPPAWPKNCVQVCVCVCCGVTSLYIPGFDMGVGSGGVSSWENGTANFSSLCLSGGFLDRFNRSISSVYSFVDLRVVLQRRHGIRAHPWQRGQSAQRPNRRFHATFHIGTAIGPRSTSTSNIQLFWFVLHCIFLFVCFVCFFFKYLWLYFTLPRPHRYHQIFTLYRISKVFKNKKNFRRYKMMISTYWLTWLKKKIFISSFV